MIISKIIIWLWYHFLLGTFEPFFRYLIYKLPIFSTMLIRDKSNIFNHSIGLYINSKIDKTPPCGRWSVHSPADNRRGSGAMPPVSHHHLAATWSGPDRASLPTLLHLSPYCLALLHAWAVAPLMKVVAPFSWPGWFPSSSPVWAID